MIYKNHSMEIQSSSKEMINFLQRKPINDQFSCQKLTSQKTIAQFFKNQLFKLEKLERSIEQFLRLLSEIKFAQFGFHELHYEYFGSFKNGFGSKSSDVDFTILTNSYVNEKQMLDYIYVELKKKIQNTQFRIVQNLSRARIPLLKLEDKKNKIEIDLCVNNILGAINTRLLATYASLHPHISVVGTIIKHWAKAQKIITSYSFSSYAIILMWLFFLQQEFFLPNLQSKDYITERNQLKIKRRVTEERTEEFETQVDFLNDTAKLKIVMEKCQVLLDRENPYSLFLKFLDYYQPRGAYDRSGMKISINRTGNEIQQLSPEEKLNNRFSMEDPFDVPHDPGKRVKSQQLKQELWPKFTKGLELLSQRTNESFQQLFEQ